MGTASAAKKGGGVQRQARHQSQGKKNLFWYTRLGKIEIDEEIFTRGRHGPEVRPFSESAEVTCRECSLALQRAIVDFGSDDPFAGASRKLREHYGIEVPVSTVRTLTEKHGEAMLARQTGGNAELGAGGVAMLIAEMDGSMVPVVETEPAEGEAVRDRRKTRTLSWKEARLCLVHEPGSVTPVFGATMGSVDEAGDRLLACALKAGAGSQTQIQGRGDGSVWILDQMDRQFGAQVRYLVDMGHVSQYLSAAAEGVVGKDEDKKKAWREQMKDWLKENRWPEVLETLRPFVEEASVSDKEAPVRNCFRYISNRSHVLDYRGALAAGLPIGTGEIESAHRYVIQIRVKIAGSWWKIENLSKMLALRVLRANGDWEDYWDSVDQEAA